MSTKIFHAYKYDGTLYELKLDLQKIRESIESALLVMTENIRLEEIGEIKKSQIHRNSAIVYVDEKNNLYVQFFLNHIFDESELLSDRFSDFHYQNQCDSRNSPDEDEERLNKWNEISLDNYDGIPIMNGFKYMLTGELTLGEIAFSKYLSKLRKE